MNTTRGDTALPDLILEQYRLRELPIDEAARVERLLSADAALRRRLEALEESDAQIARAYPPAWLAEAVRRRVDLASTRGVRWRGPLALAAAALVVLLVLPRAWDGPARVAPPLQRSQAAAEADRIKGLQPSLAVYRRTTAGSETLADGSVARPGDLLRVGYVAAGRGYGVILSIDGRGAVTLHLPPGGGHAVPLVRGGLTLLDEAYELDEAPGWERFYFVTGDAPFDVVPIMEAARKASARAGASHAPPATLPLAHGLSQSAFSIQKEVKP